MPHQLSHQQTNILLFKAFSGLARRVYPGTRRRSHPLEIRHHPVCEIWESLIFRAASLQDEELVWNQWMAFDQQQRNKSWHLLLLYLLDRRKDRALQFLRVIARDSGLKMKPRILADALEILSRHIIKLRDHTKDNTSQFSALVPTFCHIFRAYFATSKHICSQDLLLSIARLAHTEDLKLVYDLISDKVFWGYDTLLHYAATFGKYGEHKYALFCLQKVTSIVPTSSGKIDIVNRRRFSWSCALILRRSVKNGQNYHLTADIVAQFLKLGLKLDVLLYNVIIHNAMEAGDYNVAFRVYNLLEKNQVHPDKITYSILLHGCTVAKNPSIFRDFAEHCAKMARELQDPWLATDYLYYEYICHNNRNETDIERAFWIGHRTYSHFFTHGPLEWISTDYDCSLPRPQFLLQPNSDHHQDALQPHELPPLFEPPSVALYLILQLEIRRALSVSNQRVWNLYLQFRNVLRSRQNPLISELARSPIIWNAFLLAFCQGEQFANASHVIKTMPAPNIYSWNIFMQAFFKTSQIEAAERVYGIMRTRNVEPDQFTFAVLLKGYAKAQRPREVGQVMDNLDSDKQLHPALLQALGRMRDRESLMKELELSQKRKKEKEEEEERRGEDRKIERWSLPRFTTLLPRPPA